MSDLEVIRREIRADLASPTQPVGRDLEHELDRLLDTAVAGIEPTDEWLEAVEAITAPSHLEPAVAAAAVSNALRTASDVEPPQLASLRQASGLSVRDAAGRLGISTRAMENIEARPLGWVQVQASAVATYVDSLGVRRGDFVRWLAVLVAARGPDYAYGYRPKESPSEPVHAGQKTALTEDFRAWAAAVLSEVR